MRNTLLWVGLGLVAAAGLFLVIADIFTDFDDVRGEQIVSLVTATALLIVIGGGVISSYWGQGTMAVQHFAIWLGIISVITLIYSYRDVLGLNFP